MKPGMSLMKHYLQFKDLRAEEYTYLFARAAAIKTRFKNYERYQPLVDRTLTTAMATASTQVRAAGRAAAGGLRGTRIAILSVRHLPNCRRARSSAGSW